MVGSYGPYPEAAREDPAVAEPTDAWGLLAEGHPEQALDGFARRALQAPLHARPKLGYGLAAALAGDLERGVWAVRRAYRRNGAVAQGLSVDERLRPALEELLLRYRAGLFEEGSRARDAGFMSAALRQLLGEPYAAQRALETALEQGDASESARALQHSLAASR